MASTTLFRIILLSVVPFVVSDLTENNEVIADETVETMNTPDVGTSQLSSSTINSTSKPEPPIPVLNNTADTQPNIVQTESSTSSSTVSYSASTENAETVSIGLSSQLLLTTSTPAVVNASKGSTDTFKNLPTGPAIPIVVNSNASEAQTIPFNSITTASANSSESPIPVQRKLPDTKIKPVSAINKNRESNSTTFWKSLRNKVTKLEESVVNLTYTVLGTILYPVTKLCKLFSRGHVDS